jgi:hypothetical protein
MHISLHHKRGSDRSGLVSAEFERSVKALIIDRRV